jgi:hypothetical protein
LGHAQFGGSSADLPVFNWQIDQRLIGPGCLQSHVWHLAFEWREWLSHWVSGVQPPSLGSLQCEWPQKAVTDRQAPKFIYLPDFGCIMIVNVCLQEKKVTQPSPDLICSTSWWEKLQNNFAIFYFAIYYRVLSFLALFLSPKTFHYDMDFSTEN